MRLRPRLLLGILAAALLSAQLFAADGPLTNALNLRVRTDGNGYLITSGGVYSGTDGPLTSFANTRLRVDGNGYLIVAYSGAQTVSVNGIAVTSTDALVLQNTTASTVGVAVQQSPRLRFCGTAWKTDATTASQVDCALLELRPVSAAGATTSIFALATSINAGAYSDIFSITSTGGASFGLDVTSGRNFIMPAAGNAYWATRAVFASPADGQLNLTNNAATAGVGFDVATNAVAKLRTTAQSAYATFDALAYQASGTAITSGTTLLSSGSGMAVANVGANSCGTSAASIAGNNNASVITVGATAGTQCRIAFTVTAATEWDCAANDDTTTVAVRTTPIDATHTDIIGTFTAGDKVTAICFPR